MDSEESRGVDGIFISYRRDDSAGYAGRLYDRLVAHYGAERVFMDVEGIDPGTDFVDAIESAVTSCKVLIVLIGNEWLDIDDGSGRRRLDDPNDFIRIETSTALKRDIRVVPVLLDGALMPRADELPEELVGLSRRQAIEVRHKQWEASTGNLIEALDKIYFPENTGGVPAPDINSNFKGTKPTLSTNKIPWVVAGLVGVALVGSGLAYYTYNQKPITAVDVDTSPKPEVTIQAVESPPVSNERPLPPIALLGRLAVQPSKIDYGTVTSDASGVASITLSNSGNADIAASTFKVEGENADAITIDHECPDTLSPSERCVIELRFQPQNIRPLNAQFIINSADDSPITVSLAGRVEPVIPTLPPANPVLIVPPSIAAKPDPPTIQTPARPTIRPKILSFSNKVKGKSVELCYDVKDAEQLSINPQPGRLTNLRKDCVKVRLDGPTTFRLVASSKDHSVTERLSVTPELQAVTPPLPVIAATPPLPEEVIDSRFPNINDQWTYKVRGRWASSPKRTIEVSINSVAPNAVNESMSLIETDSRKILGQRSVRGPVAYVTKSDYLGTEFSPYLGAYGGLEGESNWSAIPTPDTNNFWRNWLSKGNVTGRESVTVPAGTFTAVKVEIISSRMATSGRTEAEREPVWVSYRIWYAPEVKRYVKMVRTITSASGQGIDTDTFELVSYQQK